VHEVLTERCRATDGVILHAINGTKDHVHLAINSTPEICISDLVRILKGGSAHDVNEVERMKRLEWQRGYGVVSFGRRNLTWVTKYIAGQKEHHAQGTIRKRLERTNALETDVDGRFSG
jgi:putative transposase